MSKYEDQPAFPATEEHGCNTGCSGMSLRQYLDLAVFSYAMADAITKATGETK